VLSAGLLVAGCGQVPRPTIRTISREVGGDPVVRGFREILDRRVKAVRNDDERTFLADLDERNDRLVRRQKLLFANLRQFEFTRFDYETERTTHVEEGALIRFVPVVQITQLTTDAGPGGVAPAETFQYTLVPQHDKLLITEIDGVTTDAEQIAHGPKAYAPWNFTPLQVIRAGKVWLAADSSVTDLDRYAAVAKAHLHDVEVLWGDRTRFPGHLLFFTRNTKNMKKWFSLGSYAGFSSALEGVEIPLQGVRRNGQVYGGQYAGSRIVVNLRVAEAWNDDPELVMRHELAHAVTARATSVAGGSGNLVVSAPRWAMEGFARWVETVDNPTRMDYLRYVVRVAVAAGKFSGKPPRLEDFFSEDVVFSYDLGASVFVYVEQLKGRDAVVEFYASLVAQSEPADSPLVNEPAFDQICRQVMGIRGAVFLQQWADFVRRGAV
jgi:hypothetical protein